jgi:hemerythrin-like domain-containing protein
MLVPFEPGQHRAVASWEQPFDMLRACHERVHRMLALLGKLQAHVVVHGIGTQASQAAQDVMRYFDLAAPLHHQDEELHIFPAAHRSGDPDAVAAVIRLGVEHQTMEADWRHLRTELRALLVQGVPSPLPLAWQTAQLVQTFCARYAEHIRIEERLVYPCVESILTPHDAETMGREMAERRGAGLQPRAV